PGARVGARQRREVGVERRRVVRGEVPIGDASVVVDVAFEQLRPRRVVEALGGASGQGAGGEYRRGKHEDGADARGAAHAAAVRDPRAAARPGKRYRLLKAQNEYTPSVSVMPEQQRSTRSGSSASRSMKLFA